MCLKWLCKPIGLGQVVTFLYTLLPHLNASTQKKVSPKCMPVKECLYSKERNIASDRFSP